MSTREMARVHPSSPALGRARREARHVGMPGHAHPVPAGITARLLAPPEVLQLQRTIGNRAVCRIAGVNGGGDWPAGAAVVQRMEPFFDPMAELDASSGSSSRSDDESSSESEDRQQFLDDAARWTFEDLTSDEFRENHVITPGADFLQAAKAVAERRGIPVSTSVLFTPADRKSLLREVRRRALGIGRTPGFPRDQTTNSDKYLFAEYEKTAQGTYDLADTGFGRIAYAAQGARTLGGMIYTVHHLDGIVDRQSS